MDRLAFARPIAYVYNPLNYARQPHEAYLQRYGGGRKRVVFMGMNPGPFGMAQTGVPFGDVAMVRDWMGISGKVDKPDPEHPKRPVLGFECERSEVSGSRLWGWAAKTCGRPDTFFAQCFVWNYCPLCFMEESGRNFTPDKLPAKQRTELFEACDEALRKLVALQQPEYVIGVGKFAEDRARAALQDADVTIGRILHPSPASPAANRDWSGTVEKQMAELGMEP